MGNLVNIPSVNFEDLMQIEADLKNQKENKSKSFSTFDPKNYLDTRLKKGERKREIRIRLLPNPDQPGRSPFIKVHTHTVDKLPKDISESGFKSYICLEKSDIDHEKFGSKCPFCENQRGLYSLAEKETDPDKKKEIQKLSLSNMARETVIMRVIERGKEAEGPKFWKVNISRRGDDAYSLIRNLAERLYKEGQEEGVVENIYDSYKGRDIILTISASDNEKDNKTTITVTQALSQTQISKDEEIMSSWINDNKKWSDVFVVKPYEYLSIVSARDIPWFDRETGKWIPKTEADAKRDAVSCEVNEQADADISQAEEVVNSMFISNDDEEDLPF
jgi:hypothetical protein